MIDTKAMALSILANPSAHQVNRAEKMNKTLDVMSDNLAKKQAQLDNSTTSLREDSRGYGLKHGRNTGD